MARSKKAADEAKKKAEEEAKKKEVAEALAKEKAAADAKVVILANISQFVCVFSKIHCVSGERKPSTLKPS